jgi:hypothetical protein
VKQKVAAGLVQREAEVPLLAAGGDASNWDQSRAAVLPKNGGAFRGAAEILKQATVPLDVLSSDAARERHDGAPTQE